MCIHTTKVIILWVIRYNDANIFQLPLRQWCLWFTGYLQCIPWNIKQTFLSFVFCHYNDVMMSMIASQITSLTIVYSTVYSGADQRKHQSCASLAFVRGIHRWPVNSPHKGPVTRNMFPFDDVIMLWLYYAPPANGFMWYIYQYRSLSLQQLLC